MIELHNWELLVVFDVYCRVAQKVQAVHRAMSFRGLAVRRRVSKAKLAGGGREAHTVDTSERERDQAETIRGCPEGPSRSEESVGPCQTRDRDRCKWDFVSR